MTHFTHATLIFTERHRVMADSVCEHLKVGMTAYATYEHDGLGAPAGYYRCTACRNKVLDRCATREHRCSDCGCVVLGRDITNWAPWDNDECIEDETIGLCPSCVTGEKHLARIKKDSDSYNAEFTRDDYDDY